MKNVSDFIEGYPVDLSKGEAVPIVDRIKWRLSNLSSWKTGPVSPPYPSVDLIFWRPEGGRFVNFGDELARVVVDLMLARRGASLLDEVTRPAQLIAIGSTLHRAVDGAVIWGTGLHGASLARDHIYNSIDVRAVRGPLTAKFLRRRGIAVPPVHGDPGLLLPHLDHGRFRPTGKYRVGIVPNMHEMRYIEQSDTARRFPELRIIDPRRAWNTVIADILDHSYIIASSLHGLVVADAYGIPSRYVRLTERENILKYHDYYLGTDRMLDYATSIEQALDLGGTTGLHYDPRPLMDAFPWDLWNLQNAAGGER